MGGMGLFAGQSAGTPGGRIVVVGDAAGAAVVVGAAVVAGAAVVDGTVVGLVEVFGATVVFDAGGVVTGPAGGKVLTG